IKLIKRDKHEGKNTCRSISKRPASPLSQSFRYIKTFLQASNSRRLIVFEPDPLFDTKNYRLAC
ncbi:MAG: hypothetical protein Q7T50_06875, partial [Candidatus Magasanikbacteria bacterium]|nr:hypothetical protein [Candidatus Magasanikbacteria bacterium]